jgi:hypothetical protein
MMKLVDHRFKQLALLLALILTGYIGSSFAKDAPSALPYVFSDGDNAKPSRTENMHMTRFLEIYLAAPDPKTGELIAACYNTMFTPQGIPASKNTAPQKLVEGLNFEKMKSDYHVAGASLNGPKYWLADWTDIEEGVTRSFNGIEATWVAQLEMGKRTDVDNVSTYEPHYIARKSSLGWNKGTQALLLDDPEGNVWIMKGFELGIHPKKTYEEFVAAGASNFKKLPPGWKFRIKVLDKNYIETPETGVATVMVDEFFNVYDKTGPGMGNYKP